RRGEPGAVPVHSIRTERERPANDSLKGAGDTPAADGYTASNRSSDGPGINPGPNEITSHQRPSRRSLSSRLAPRSTRVSSSPGSAGNLGPLGFAASQK